MTGDPTAVDLPYDPAMQTDEFMNSACSAMAGMAPAWYFAPATSERGQALGLDAFHFYFLGRGGVLGDVEAPVVASAFGYFEPATVERMWGEARAIADPRETGRLYMACCQEFGRARLGGVEGLEAFCDAAGAVNEATDPAGLALYAGIRAEPLADDPAGRAMQLTAVLRELRGSAHLVAVLASGLAPKVAHFIRRPDMFATFGWRADETPVVTDGDRAKLEDAERLTDQLLAPAFSVLDDPGRQAMVATLEAMQAAIAAP
jgi:hypothetical protein